MLHWTPLAPYCQTDLLTTQLMFVSADPEHEGYRGHFRLHLTEHASVQFHLDLWVPHAGGGSRLSPGTGSECVRWTWAVEIVGCIATAT